jgi:hypothetical protein
LLYKLTQHAGQSTQQSPIRSTREFLSILTANCTLGERVIADALSDGSTRKP